MVSATLEERKKQYNKNTFCLKKMSNIYANSLVFPYTWINTLTEILKSHLNSYFSPEQGVYYLTDKKTAGFVSGTLV